MVIKVYATNIMFYTVQGVLFDIFLWISDTLGNMFCYRNSSIFHSLLHSDDQSRILDICSNILSRMGVYFRIDTLRLCYKGYGMVLGYLWSLIPHKYRFAYPLNGIYIYNNIICNRRVRENPGTAVLFFYWQNYSCLLIEYLYVTHK